MKSIRGGLTALIALILGLAGTVSATSLPTCTISVPPGVRYGGQAVRLLWVSQDATSATIATIGAIPPEQIAQGFRDIYPTGNTLITMTVGNGLGTRTCSALITLNNLPAQTQTQTVYQPITYTTNQVQYVPVNSNWYPQNTWTPFYASSPSKYSYTSDSYYGNSYYYSGNYYDRYESFYDTAGSSYGYKNYASDNSYNDPYTYTHSIENTLTGEKYSATRDCYGLVCDAAPSSWSYTPDPDALYIYPASQRDARNGYEDNTEYPSPTPPVAPEQYYGVWNGSTPPPKDDSNWSQSEGRLYYGGPDDTIMQKGPNSYDI